MSWVWEIADSNERLIAKSGISQEVNITYARLPASLALQEISVIRSTISRASKQEGGSWYTDETDVNHGKWPTSEDVTIHESPSLLLQPPLVLQQALLIYKFLKSCCSPGHRLWEARSRSSGGEFWSSFCRARRQSKQASWTNKYLEKALQRWELKTCEYKKEDMTEERLDYQVKVNSQEGGSWLWLLAGGGMLHLHALHLAIWFGRGAEQRRMKKFYQKIAGRTPHVIRERSRIERRAGELEQFSCTEPMRFIL